MASLSWDFLRRGFIAAGAINIGGTLLFSKGLSNDLVTSQYPQIFSREGLVTIIIWGGAYLAAVPSLEAGREKQPWTYAMFGAEKAFYTGTWLVWAMRQPSLLKTLQDILAKDVLSALFMAAYGLNDAIFGAVFAVATVKALKGRGSDRQKAS
jgi:hypothetical protein